MRLSLLLLPFLLASGCIAADDAATTGKTDGDSADGGMSIRQGVVFHNQPYEALPNEPLEVRVQVPDGATNVELEMSVSGAASPLDEAVVTLSGCGQAYVSWSQGSNVVVGVSGGGSWREADLCPAAQGGLRLLNVDTGATPMVGRILLRADLPA